MNHKQFITRSAVIFVALTTAEIIIVASAQAIPNSFTQTVMVAIGSAIFGAGLSFFLVRITTLTEK